MRTKKQNWNVVAVCNASGTVMERYTYDAFGKRNVFDASFTAKANTDYNWNRAFTGQVLDMETMLMLYRMRYYNTLIGRFVNRDPVGYQAADENLYRYVYNASVNTIDFLGLQAARTQKGWWSRLLDWMFATGSYAAPTGVGEVVGVLEVVGTAMQPDKVEEYIRYRLDREEESTPDYDYWQERLNRCQKMRNR